MTLWLLPLVPMCAAATIAVWRPVGRAVLCAVAAATLLLTVVVACMAAAAGWTATLDWGPHLQLRAALLPSSAVMTATVGAIALAVSAYAAWHEPQRGLVRLVALLLFFAGAMELLVIADDFLTLLVGWELVGACSWALIGHEWRTIEAPRSALFAFLATRLGDLGLFLAAMAAYAGGGSFAFDGLARLDAPSRALVAAGVLLCATAKSGQVPFSSWLFRAMAGPTSVSALLHAATMVAAGAWLLLRLQPALASVAWFGPAAVVVGVLTALAGGVVALLQCHAKKLLAASTSAQFGLMFVAIGAGYPGIALLHVVAHACFKASLFMAAGIAGERSGGYALASMRLGRALPIVAILAGIAALALAGVPPLGAAWSKEQIVATAMRTSPWAGVAVLLAGGLSAAYAARFQQGAFGRRDEKDLPAQRREPPHRVESSALAALALATLALSLLWVPALHERALDSLHAVFTHPSGWEMAASLAAVAIGAYAGFTLARRMPTLGERGVPAAASDWLGLPWLIDRGITRPVHGFARLLARADTVIDTLPGAAAHAVGRTARLLEFLDQAGIDRGVQGIAATGTWLARIGDRFGEVLADGLARGPAWLSAAGGRDLRPLQSGMSHQYFAGMAAAAVLVLIVLFFAG
jgi:NADH-quinone oxidoreductase subunit L